MRPDAQVQTRAILPCPEHPPLSEWPEKNLIVGTCPSCGQCGMSGLQCARELSAREAIRERGL